MTHYRSCGSCTFKDSDDDDLLLPFARSWPKLYHCLAMMLLASKHSVGIDDSKPGLHRV